MPDIFTKKKKVLPVSKPHQYTPPSSNKTPTDTVKQKPNSNHLGMMATFTKHPADVRLFGQDDDEHIILFLRRDFITNVPWIIVAIIFLLLPFFVAPFFDLANISIDFVPGNIAFLIGAFYYLLLAGYAFTNFLTWFYTIGIISNKKAYDIDFQNLSTVHVGTVNLPDTSDAKYTQRGFFQSFFNYGDITITIEATKEQFVFERTPRPAEITDMLSDLIGEA